MAIRDSIGKLYLSSPEAKIHCTNFGLETNAPWMNKKDPVELHLDASVTLDACLHSLPLAVTYSLLFIFFFYQKLYLNIDTK